jgi:hypothetical protein
MTRPVSAWGIIAGIVVGGAFGLTATVALATKPPTPGLSTYALPTADLRLLDWAPYRVQQPTDLPSGMTLAAVSVVGPAETKGGVFSVDMTWTDANGHAIHVWQTNMTEFIGTSLDPVVGAPVTVGGSSWRAVDHEVGDRLLHVLSTRNALGITIAVDTDLDPSVLKGVAESLR